MTKEDVVLAIEEDIALATEEEDAALATEENIALATEEDDVALASEEKDTAERNRFECARNHSSSLNQSSAGYANRCSEG